MLTTWSINLGVLNMLLNGGFLSTGMPLTNLTSSGARLQPSTLNTMNFSSYADVLPLANCFTQFISFSFDVFTSLTCSLWHPKILAYFIFVLMNIISNYNIHGNLVSMLLLAWWFWNLIFRLLSVLWYITASFGHLRTIAALWILRVFDIWTVVQADCVNDDDSDKPCVISWILWTQWLFRDSQKG